MNKSDTIHQEHSAKIQRVSLVKKQAAEKALIRSLKVITKGRVTLTEYKDSKNIKLRCCLHGDWSGTVAHAKRNGHYCPQCAKDRATHD